MSRLARQIGTTMALAAAVAACHQQPKEDPRVAALEKELAAMKQEVASAKDAQARAAAGQAAVATEAVETANAARKAAASAQQTAASAAGQAEENLRLKRELEEMKPREYSLPAGTTIPVRTTAEISTAKVKDGSVFDATLEHDIVVNGATLAKAGALVTCIVVSSHPGGRVKGVASLEVAARSIAGVGGNTLAIETERYHVDADTTKGRDAARTGVVAGVGAIVGGIAGGGKGAAIGAGAGAATGAGVNLATRGKAAEIPAETLIEFRLSAPATVVIRK